MSNKEPWEIEDAGYDAGVNPMMGSFHRKFGFQAVPYGHRDRQEFINKVQQSLSDVRYVYYREVKVEIDLYLDEQERLETPDLADLDNYAKLLCDCLKGDKGLLIDDSQIQTLSIAWIDTTEPSYFEVSITGHPDEFVLKPLSLYEMPDGLFYPLSDYSWTIEGVEDVSQEERELMLVSLHEIIRQARDSRHKSRQHGSSRIQAFWHSHSCSPILSGFHKSRVIDSGFNLYHMVEWRSNMTFDTIAQKLKDNPYERFNMGSS